MILNISLDRKPLQQFYHFVEDFDKTLKKGLINAMMFAEGQAKRSFGEPGRLKSRSGRLRGSITSGVDDPLTGWLASDVIYGPIHEFGGTIKPKVGKYLKFQIAGQWKTVKQVVIPAKPFLRPAIQKSQDNMVEIITRQIVRDFNDNS